MPTVYIENVLNCKIALGICAYHLCLSCEDVCRTAVRHTSSHRTHVHTPNIMLPHHHIDFYIFNKF